MADWYVEPTGNDTKGFFEYFNYVNTVADGLFFPIMLLVMWVIIFVSILRYGVSRAWATASFVLTGFAIPLAIAGLIAPWIMYLLIFFTAIGIIWLKLDLGGV